MRKWIAIVVCLSGLTAVSAAQVPTSGNVFFGYQYYHTPLSSIDTANLNGWNGSLEGKVFPFLGIVADLSGAYGSQNFPCSSSPGCTVHANVNEYNFLFGPRVSVSVKKIRPFGEFLIGAAHTNTNAGAGSNTSFAYALGGGVDYRVVRIVGWRVGADYVSTRFFGTTQNNVRIITGIVVHF
ncbi:MAG TPA: hypothetical protein VLW84_13705 [Terriglobales bacterium]|nr:hypothetical protein [Terriglobales bacterium]